MLEWCRISYINRVRGDVNEKQNWDFVAHLPTTSGVDAESMQHNPLTANSKRMCTQWAHQSGAPKGPQHQFWSAYFWPKIVLCKMCFSKKHNNVCQSYSLNIPKCLPKRPQHILQEVLEASTEKTHTASKRVHFYLWLGWTWWPAWHSLHTALQAWFPSARYAGYRTAPANLPQEAVDAEACQQSFHHTVVVMGSVKLVCKFQWVLPAAVQ